MDDANGLHEFAGRRSFIHVTLRPRSDGLQNGFFINAGTCHNDAQVGAAGLQAGHKIKQVLAVPVSQQDQVDVGQICDVGERGGDELKVRLGVEQGPEAYEA